MLQVPGINAGFWSLVGLLLNLRLQDLPADGVLGLDEELGDRRLDRQFGLERKQRAEVVVRVLECVRLVLEVGLPEARGILEMQGPLAVRVAVHPEYEASQ